MSTHPCEASGCGRPVASGRLLCLPHWRMVPRDTQREVNATWATYQRTRAAVADKRLRYGPGEDVRAALAAFGVAVDAYRSAREEAIRMVTGAGANG